MERKVKISPSIIATDYKSSQKISEVINILNEGKVALVHLDVMDGKFVPATTFGVDFIKKMHSDTDFLLDVHLMVEMPDEMIEDYIDSGADILTIHYEATSNIEWCLRKIRLCGALAGVAISPNTDVSVLEPYIKAKLIDIVVVMSVEPGACGRVFDERAIGKIKSLREQSSKIDIEVDGGINLDNILQVVEAGANIVVAGSAIFNANDPVGVIREMSSYKYKKK